MSRLPWGSKRPNRPPLWETFVRPESPAIIFVVDDDEVVRESLKALLEARRYVVLDFPSGVEFLSRRDGAGPIAW
jgi:hypothetical protein